MPPGESTWVRVLIIQPDVEAQFLPSLNRVGAECEPFVGEILGDQAWPRVDEDPAESQSTKVGQLVADLLLGHPVVPNPEGSRPEFSGWILEVAE
jgi:hypothetical protein